jgi:hypothetical protein
MNNRIFAVLHSVFAITGLFLVAPIAAYAQQQQSTAVVQAGGSRRLL